MTRAWIAIALIAAARVISIVWFSPYELVADEAQYWDWSRRLSLSYYSKGPGVAWAIAASTAIFGVSEWAVRLPAVLACAVASWAAARFAIAFVDDRAQASRAAVIAVVLVNLLPVYQLTAIFMTTDAPYIACWAVAVLCAWRAYTGERDGRPSLAAWIACGFAIGVGFLFKYTIVLLVPGLMWFAWLMRRQVPRAAGWRALAAIAVAALTMSPVLIWNLDHQQAGLSHLLGYLGAPGGDRRPVAYNPWWTLRFPLEQAAVVGPAIGLMAIAARRGMTIARPADDASAACRLAVCSAAPALLVFFAATVQGGEANWPAASYSSLIPAAAALVAARTDARVIRWWRAAVAYGVVAFAGIHAPLAVARLPLVGDLVPTQRFQGAAARARQVWQSIERLDRRDAYPLLVTPSHHTTGLLAFYVPGHPVVASAGRYFGDRPSAYDFFEDTSLERPLAPSRQAVLIGVTREHWQNVFLLHDLALLDPDGPQWITHSFGGPRR
jgi:4-amino-4-deoxy-L-arabinose transferase-like glycosyltransferase